MHKFIRYLSINSYPVYCLSLVFYKFSQMFLHWYIQLSLQFMQRKDHHWAFVHPAAFGIFLKKRPPLIAFDVNSQWREWVLNVLVWTPALSKISNPHLDKVIDDTGLGGGVWLIKTCNLHYAAAVLSICNLIDATAHIHVRMP